MKLPCAVDAGLGAFKFLEVDQLECDLLDSVLAPPRRLGFGEKPHLTIRYEEIETVVGSDARLCNMARSCWSSGKVSQDVRLLMLASLGLVARRRGQNHLDVLLVSALPVGLWGSHRYEFAKQIRGRHQFLLGGSAYSLDIELSEDKILPEPYGSYVYCRSLRLFSKEAVGIVDVGQSTVDYALVDNEGNVDGQYSTHRDLGMGTFYKLVTEQFSSLTGQYLDPTRVETLYMSGITEFQQLGQTFNISDIFHQARMHYGQQVVSAMLGLWKGVALNRIILTGGGAETVFPAFVQTVAEKLGKTSESILHQALYPAHNSKAVLIMCPEARTANARGLAIWLQQQKALSAA